MKSPRWLLLAVLLFVLAPLMHAQQVNGDRDFRDIQPVLDSLRVGSEPEVSVRLDEDSFAVRRAVRASIEKADGEELLKKSPNLEGLRITEDKVFVVFKVGDGVWIEQQLGSQGEQLQWNKKTLTTLATYPRDNWEAFLKFLVANGLVHFVSSETKDGTSGLMMFSPTGPNSFSYPGNELRIPKDFYRSMRFSPKYRPSTGTQGFVVIVHDPHSDVAGRFALLRGLDVLCAANPTTSISFLNEGAFSQRQGVDYYSNLSRLSGRSISDSGLNDHVKNLPPNVRTAVVQRMLEKYLIDVPRAYQLLHSKRPVASFKIDDNRYLTEPQNLHVSRSEERNALLTAIKSVGLGGKPGAQSARVVSRQLTQTVQFQVNLIALSEQADTNEMSDTGLRDFFRDLSGMLHELSQSISQLNSLSADESKAIRTLELKAKEYSGEASTFQNALLRNKTMSRLIIEAALHPEMYGLPFAFIGNYHTAGITSELRRNGIGYVVIEPQVTSLLEPRELEERSFRRFIEDPNSYFASVKTNKGLAELTPQQVLTYHTPFMESNSRSLQTHAQSIARALEGAQSKVDVRRLSAVLMDNPYATLVEVSGGGSGAAPPDLPSGTFAFFDSSNGKPRLTILDPASEEWTSNGLYAFLGQVALRVRSREGSVSTVEKTRILSLYGQDPVTGHVYFSFYDSETNRVYLVHTEIGNVGRLLDQPTKKSNQNAEFGMQVAELLTEGKEQHGDTEARTPLRENSGD